jgi:hypothetical protein
MNSSQFLKFLLFFGAGFVVGFFTFSFLFQDKILIKPQEPFVKKQENLGEIRVSLIIDFSDGKIITCNNQILKKGSTVFDLLKICSQNPQNPFEIEYTVYPELGVFIKRIGDKTNGENEKYWQYWVNNEYAQVGAGSYQLKEGDIVEWKFVKSQF